MGIVSNQSTNRMEFPKDYSSNKTQEAAKSDPTTEKKQSESQKQVTNQQNVEDLFIGDTGTKQTSSYYNRASISEAAEAYGATEVSQVGKADLPTSREVKTYAKQVLDG